MAGLVDARERTTVIASANVFDEKTVVDGGCDPSGCTADLTRDLNLNGTSRWSCKFDLESTPCQLWYSFEDPQDIVRLEIAFYKGDERTRAFSVTTFNDFGSSSFNYEFVSSGGTLDYELFEINSSGVLEMFITPLDPNFNDWLSIVEVILI